MKDLIDFYAYRASNEVLTSEDIVNLFDEDPDREKRLYEEWSEGEKATDEEVDRLMNAIGELAESEPVKFKIWEFDEVADEVRLIAYSQKMEAAND